MHACLQCLGCLGLVTLLRGFGVLLVVAGGESVAAVAFVVAAVVFAALCIAGVYLQLRSGDRRLPACACSCLSLSVAA